jgi:hypothetical protein
MAGMIAPFRVSGRSAAGAAHPAAAPGAPVARRSQGAGARPSARPEPSGRSAAGAAHRTAAPDAPVARRSQGAGGAARRLSA